MADATDVTDAGDAGTPMQWVKVDPGVLHVGRVATVIAAGQPVCLARTEQGYGALDNRCPHQGGPSSRSSPPPATEHWFTPGFALRSLRRDRGAPPPRRPGHEAVKAVSGRGPGRGR
jgi:hypothetical protein